MPETEMRETLRSLSGFVRWLFEGWNRERKGIRTGIVRAAVGWEGEREGGWPALEGHCYRGIVEWGGRCLGLGCCQSRGGRKSEDEKGWKC